MGFTYELPPDFIHELEERAARDGIAPKPGEVAFDGSASASVADGAESSRAVNTPFPYAPLPPTMETGKNH